MILAIDLGGTNCRSALIAADGSIVKPRRMATRGHEGRAALLHRLAELCHSYSRKYPLTGVGIGFPGLLTADGTVVSAPNLSCLDGVPLAVQLQQDVGCPVTVINDADATALGEGAYGAAHSFSSFLAVTLGTGVGGGLVLQRRLWQGAHGSAGEIGHVTVVPQGRPCGCGNSGCVERYASATGLRLSVLEALASGQSSPLSAFPAADLDARQIAAAARHGDAVARQAWNCAGQTLGQALASVVNLLDLDGVVVCGGVAASYSLLHRPLLAALHRHSFVFAAHPLPVIRGKLGDRAGLLGAAVQARLYLPHGCGGLTC